MEFLFGYRTKKLWLLLIRFFCLAGVIIFFLHWNFVQENAKARASIECSKAQNTCVIRRVKKPEVFKINLSALKKAKYYCVSSYRGRCTRYDVEFIFKDENQYARLLGADIGSQNQKEIDRITNSFNLYLENNADYLFLEKSEEFYVPFVDLLLLFFLVFIFPFFLLKNQEVYFDKKNERLVIKKYNIFNLICQIKKVKISKVKEFYMVPYCDWYHIKCKPVNIWGFDYKILQIQNKEIADKICKVLNDLLT